MREDTVLQQAIYKWGTDRQIDKLIEEMSELSKALLKHRHHQKDHISEDKCLNNIYSEIADVEILIAQIKSKSIYNCKDEVSEVRRFKINRLNDILNF